MFDEPTTSRWSTHPSLGGRVGTIRSLPLDRHPGRSRCRIGPVPDRHLRASRLAASVIRGRRGRAAVFRDNSTAAPDKATGVSNRSGTGLAPPLTAITPPAANSANPMRTRRTGDFGTGRPSVGEDRAGW